MIFSLLQKRIRKEHLEALTAEEWKEIAETGIRFSTDVCLSLDNYVSETFANGLR